MRVCFALILLLGCTRTTLPTLTPVPITPVPTSVPATLAPTPPSPTPQIAGQPTSAWRMVAQFKGYDGGITKPFTTTGPWRLTYLIEESLVLAVRAYPDGRILLTRPLLNQRLDGKPHIGSLTIAQAGSFALDLSPIGYYQVDVEEPRR